jgi:hypothetical protein
VHCGHGPECSYAGGVTAKKKKKKKNRKTEFTLGFSFDRSELHPYNSDV